MTDFLNGSAFLFPYYLFTLIAIEAAFGIAYGHWRRSLSPVARRFAVGFGALGGARLLFLLLLLPWFRPQSVNHMVLVISLAILTWNFAPYLIQRPGTGVFFLAGNALLAFILLGLQNILAADTAFSVVWLLWEVGLSVLTLASLLLNLRQANEMVIISFGLLIIGGGLQLILELQGTQYLGLAEMVAYPLLTLAVYQIVIESLNLRNKEFQDLTKSSLEQIEGLISLFETTKEVISSLELSQVLDGAARGVVEVVKVDQCAIALPEEGETSQLRLVAAYNPNREGRGEAITFPLNEQPAIKHALERLREVEISTGYDTPQFKFLFALMGARDNTGPLIIHPLVSKNTAIGVLIVGNAYSKQSFGPTKLQLIKAMANQIAIAVDNARSYQTLMTKSQQLAWTLRNQEQESGRRQAAMEAELRKSREEVNMISQRLHEQDVLTKNNQRLLTDYQQQISRLRQQLEEAQNAFAQLSQENEQLSALSQHLEQAQQAEEALVELKGRLRELEAKAAEAEKLRADLADAQRHGRKLVRALRLSQAKIQQMAGMPTSITTPQIHTELDNLSCGLLISDGEGVISRVNTATTSLINREAKDLIGQTLADVSEDEKWQRALQKITLSGENLVSASFKVDQKIIKASISPLVDSDNQKISGNVVILYDATEEAESQRARDEFIASLSQDLRTPMTSISGYVDLLLGESVGIIADMQRKFLQRVKANVERMELMLKDLIGVTAIDAGQFDIKPVPIDMAEVIEDAIIGAKAQLEEKEIQVHLDLPEEMPPVEVDPDSIQQVMANLLSNATKSTPVGGNISVKAMVTRGNSHASGSEEEQWLQVTVTDSGGGIAEKDLDRVFDRFYLAERPLIQGLGETGVGLSIVKYLIEAHGGKVWLDTDMGKGSSFHIMLLIKDYYNDPWQDLDVPPLDLNVDDADF